MSGVCLRAGASKTIPERIYALVDVVILGRTFRVRPLKSTSRLLIAIPADLWFDRPLHNNLDQGRKIITRLQATTGEIQRLERSVQFQNMT